MVTFISKLLKINTFVILVCFWSYGQKHTVSFNTGVRCFFDSQTPVFETSKNTSFLSEMFNLNYGLSYSYKIKEKSLVKLGIDWFEKRYNVDGKVIPYMFVKRFFTVNARYERTLLTLDKFTFSTNIGMLYRHGGENIVIASGSIGGSEFNELIIESVQVRNFGAVLGFNTQYDFASKWFLSNNIDFTGFFFLYDTERLHDVYDIKQYPSRFDLNFQLGIGRRFGK